MLHNYPWDSHPPNDSCNRISTGPNTAFNNEWSLYFSYVRIWKWSMVSLTFAPYLIYIVKQKIKFIPVTDYLHPQVTKDWHDWRWSFIQSFYCFQHYTVYSSLLCPAKYRLLKHTQTLIVHLSHVNALLSYHTALVKHLSLFCFLKFFLWPHVGGGLGSD